MKLLKIGNDQNNLEEAWQQPGLKLVREKSVCAPLVDTWIDFKSKLMHDPFVACCAL